MGGIGIDFDESMKEDKKVTIKWVESARKSSAGLKKKGESTTEKANVLQSLSP